MTADGPLAGLRVLDLSWVIAGPHVGRVLADFGATVIRVESTHRVDTARLLSPFHGDVRSSDGSAAYGNVNAGKLGVAIDMKTAAGRAVAHRLASRCDVVAESYSPGVVESWGLGYESLAVANPALIMLSTSLMGRRGPYADVGGFGNIGAALSGFQNLAGWPDRAPLGPYGPYTDYVAPRFALVALLAALDERERTGLGRHIDVSQVEATIHFLGAEVADYSRTGRVAQRRGNRDTVMAPHGVYPCQKDAVPGRSDWVAIAVRDDVEWARLAAVLGRAELASDPRYATARARLESSDELDEIVASWTSGRTAARVENHLQAAGIPAHVAASSADAIADPQLAHRNHFVRLPHQRLGETYVEASRYQLSRTPGQVERPAPDVGQHTVTVLREIAGFSSEEIEELLSSGAVDQAR